MIGIVHGQKSDVQSVNHKRADINGNVQISSGDTDSIPAERGAVTEEYLGTNSVTQQKIKQGAVSTIYNFTIPSSGWQQDSQNYYIHVIVDGILSSDHPIIGTNWGDPTIAEGEALKEELSKIININTQNGELSIRATEPITRSLNMQALCIRR